MSSIREFLQKSTTDAEQRRDDKRAIRELKDVERVLEEGAEHEEAEMKAEKSRSREEWKEVKRRKEQEYGTDEYYADPAHDSYPLTKDGKPSRERTMAAWRYINAERNARKYTPEQLERVKGRIKAFAKKHFNEELQDRHEKSRRGGIREYALSKAR